MNNSRQTSPHFTSLSHLLVACVLGSLYFAAVAVAAHAYAQPSPQNPSMQDAAPPVMKFIPRDDRARLDAESNDAKKRIRTSLELAAARLERAATLTNQEQFDAAATEIGIYLGLLEDAMRFLDERKEIKNGKVSNKYRDIYKRVELTLRAHAPRLETIRRQTPSEDAVNIRAAYEFTRKARAEALDNFFIEMVAPAAPGEKERTAGDGKDTKSAPTDAPPAKPEQR